MVYSKNEVTKYTVLKAKAGNDNTNSSDKGGWLRQSGEGKTKHRARELTSRGLLGKGSGVGRRGGRCRESVGAGEVLAVPSGPLTDARSERG